MTERPKFDLDWDVVALRQTLWDVYEILGAEERPAHIPDGELRTTVLGTAREFRNAYESLLEENTEPDWAKGP